jgi:hypothetical protein
MEIFNDILQMVEFLFLVMDLNVLSLLEGDWSLMNLKKRKFLVDFLIDKSMNKATNTRTLWKQKQYIDKLPFICGKWQFLTEKNTKDLFLIWYLFFS